MDDKKKTKEQLIKELTETRQCLSDKEKLLHEHLKIEMTLRKSEERYRDLTEKTSDCLWEADTRFCFTYISPRVKDMIGYSPDELLGQPPAYLVGPEENVRLRSLLDDPISNPHALRGFVYQVHHKEHCSLRILETNAVPRFNQEGQFIGYRGVTRDITKRKMMERALRKSEERFQLISQASNDAIYDWDIPSGTAWLSEAHRKFLGFPENAGYVKWWRSHLHPADRQRITDNVRSLMKGNASVWMVEYRFLSAEGRYIDVVDRGQIIRDEKGKPVRIVGSMMNVTARKLAEAALLHSEENYLRLIEDSPIGIVVQAPDCRVIISNSRARHLLGIMEDQFWGQSNYDPNWIFLREDGSELLQEEYPVNLVIAQNAPVNNLVQGIIRPTRGAVTWLLINAQPQWDQEGELIRIIVSFLDITARKKAEEALELSEAKYRFLTEKMNDIVWTTDMNLDFTYFSPSIQRALGYNPEELLGRKPMDIMVSESIDHALDVWEKRLSRNQETPLDPYSSFAFEAGFFHKNGSVIWFDNVASFIRDDNGKIIGSYGVSRNITEQKLATVEREKLIEDLKQAFSEVKTLSGLLPICSHCKKIRDDSGYWKQLESYISEHSDALFSHGICPDCAAKHYSGIFADEKP